MGLLIIQIIIVIILLVIIIYMIRQNIALSYEKRISNYSIDSLKSKEMSLSDKLFLKYKKLVIKFRPFISKVGLFKFLSKKYEKYIVYTNDKDNILAIDYVTHKLFIGLALVLLTIFSLVLQTRLATLFELVINFLIGFFILDIYLWYKDRLYKKRIDNELLRAVIVINNSFKSGKSTMQSLEAASYDLPEPIRSEFYKMYQEMKYGLGIETVFDRFSKRIDLEEIKV